MTEHPPRDAPVVTPRAPVPTEGDIPVRVRYPECDPMGVAHHAAHPIWLEIARTELLRRSGVSYRDLEADGVFLVVVRLEMNYRRPARYDDELIVRCAVTGGSSVKLIHEYTIRREGADDPPGGTVICEASSVLACVGRDGKVRQLPAWLTHRARSEPA